MTGYNTHLGLCIPTYKRPDQLRLCVTSLIVSAAPFGVPIFIADDSTDDTNLATVQALQEQYSYIIHEQNQKNLGIDRNILHCADICPCNYAWLFGEDDRMLPEGVAAVLAVLARESPAFLAVNYSSVNEEVSMIIKEKLMDISADTERSADDFLRREAPAIGFIGGCVVNKTLWDQVDPEPYLDTYFAHVGRILASLQGRCVFLLAKPLVLNRAGGAAAFSWSDDAYGVYTGWEKVIRRLEPLYGVAVCRECIAAFDRLHGLSTLRFMMAKRADRIYNRDIYRQMIRGSEQCRFYKWVAHLVAWMPPLPFRVLHVLISQVRQRRNRKVELHP